MCEKYYLDLFSGIGGFALGALWAGFEFNKHYYSEIDKYAVDVYKKRFPTAEALGDIKDVNYEKLPKGEYYVTAGFPCQPHSIAGKKQASKDERDLWPECRRMLRELRPRAALFENVPGLFISDGGRFFNGIMSDIYRCGYDAEWQVISASEIGAPHIRKRVWIACYPNNRGGTYHHHWRTPDANMERGNRSYENMKMRLEKGKPLNLNDQLNAIHKGLLPEPSKKYFPTPTASDASTGAIMGKDDVFYLTANGIPRRINKSGNDGSLGLARYVKYIPTPQKRDFRSGQANRVNRKGKQNNLNDYAKLLSNNDGQLNPDWVEALMGYPYGWTDIDKEIEFEIDYPARWLNEKWENNIPRITQVAKNRINRLMCLGNSVVPEIPYILWLLVNDMIEYENKETL